MGQSYIPDEKDRIDKGDPEQVDYPPTIAIVSVNSADFKPPVPCFPTFHQPHQGGLPASLLTHPPFHFISLAYRLFDIQNI